MIKRQNILLIFFMCLIVPVNAQTFDLEKFNEEKEKILNIVINSTQFDSVYSAKKVSFVESELLSVETPLVLKRKCKKVSIVKDSKQLKSKEYAVLGDFTMARHNPVRVRVQITIMPRQTLLNFGLEKKNGKWEIVNHLIMKE